MIGWRDPDGRPERKIAVLSVLRWLTAVTFAAAAHGGAVWMALNWKSAMAAGEPPPAVMIELAPLAVAPEAPSQDVAPGPQMAQAQSEPMPDVPDKPVEDPIEKPKALIQQLENLIEKLPEISNTQAVFAPPPPQPVAVSKPPPKTAKREKPLDPKKTRAPQTTAPPTSQAQRADRAAAPSGSASLNPSMSPASWRGALMAHLNRHKRFPGGAADTGIVTVAFTIDRSGRVLSSRLIRSSGNAALDAEGVSLPRRASPVPAPPPNIGGGSVTLAVPIRFNR